MPASRECRTLARPRSFRELVLPRLTLLLVLLAMVALEREVRACAVCAAGETTLAPRESNRPASGTFGGAVDVRAGALRSANTSRLDEIRSEASVHIAPIEGYRFRLAMPVLARKLVAPGVDASRTLYAGDLTTSMETELDRSTREAFGRSWQRVFALSVGLAFPTAPAVTDTKGAYLPSIFQPGCNAVTPEVELSYRFTASRFTFSVSPRARLPLPVRNAPHRGAIVGLGASVQWQPHVRFAARVGTSARLELEGADAQGRGDGLSGGFFGYVSPELVVRPTLSTTLTAGLYAPIVQSTRGGQFESAIFATRLSFEL
jgi:hypothetical protein